MGFWDDLWSNWKLWTSLLGFGSLAAASVIILRRSNATKIIGATAKKKQIQSRRKEPTKNSTPSELDFPKVVKVEKRPGEFLGADECRIKYADAQRVQSNQLKAVMDDCTRREDHGSLVNILFVQTQTLVTAIENELTKNGPGPDMQELFEITITLFQRAILAAEAVNHQFGPTLLLQYGSILLRYTNNKKEGAEFMQGGLLKFLDLLKFEPELASVVPGHISTCLNTLTSRYFKDSALYEQGLEFIQTYIDKYNALGLPDERSAEVISPPKESEFTTNHEFPILDERCDESIVQVIWNLLIMSHMYNHGKNEEVLQQWEKMQALGLAEKRVMTVEYYLATQILIGRSYQKLKRYDEAEAIYKMLIGWHISKSREFVERITQKSQIEQLSIDTPDTRRALDSIMLIYEQRLLEPILMQFPIVLKFYQEAGRPEEGKTWVERAEKAVKDQVQRLGEAYGPARVDRKIVDRFTEKLGQVQVDIVEEQTKQFAAADELFSAEAQEK